MAIRFRPIEQENYLEDENRELPNALQVNSDY